MTPAKTVEALYQAFLDADEAAVAKTIGNEFELHVAWPGLLAGRHRGAAGMVALRQRLAEATGGTFRPWREDSRDVAVSEHHAVLMDRWVGRVGAVELDAHVAIIFGIESGRPVIAFFYVEKPAALECLG